MPAASLYVFTHAELLKCLIEKSNVHEGKWGLRFAFGQMILNFPKTPELTLPGVAIMVDTIAIERIENEAAVAPGAVVLDAAVVNPDRQSN